MNIIIYANSSFYIGTGHVMRCLTLADYFSSKGANIAFMSDITLPGNISSLVIEKGYKIISPSLENIKENTDWLIIDNYDIDGRFETDARKYVKNIMVIDDLANRQHDCDILLDQNLYNNPEKRYDGLVPKDCKLLLGPKYALLRDEFLEARKSLKVREGKINRIFVNFGGSDPVNMTSQVLKLLTEYGIETDVVVSERSLYLEEVKNICLKVPYFNLHIQTSQIAHLMAKADLAIAAGGSSTWERVCLGLPSIVVAIADNQIELSETLAQKELSFYAGFYKDNSMSVNLIKLINHCITNPIMVKQQSSKMITLLDGNGRGSIWRAIAG